MIVKNRYILKVFLLLTILGLFSACGDLSFIPPRGNGGGGDTGGGDTGGDINPIFKPFSNDLYFGRNYLNADEQKAYDLALKTMLDNYSKLVFIYVVDGYEVEGRVKIDLTANNIVNIKTTNQLNKIVSFITNDEPRLFHISSSIPRSTPYNEPQTPYLKDADGNIKEFYIRIGMRYDKYSTYVDEMKTIEVRVKNVLEAVGDTSKISKPQIVRKLYEEYLATVAYGNMNNTDGGNIRGSFLKPASTDYYKRYLVVCEGYSRSMLYLLQRLGFKAVYIEGMTTNGLHAWNKVEINGSWYNLDSTWDDSSTLNSTDSRKGHFLQSDAKFLVIHNKPQISSDGRPSGYLYFGVQIPASAPNSLTGADYN